MHIRSAVDPVRFSGTSAFLVCVRVVFVSEYHNNYPNNCVDRISHHRDPYDNHEPLKYQFTRKFKRGKRGSLKLRG